MKKGNEEREKYVCELKFLFFGRKGGVLYAILSMKRSRRSSYHGPIDFLNSSKSDFFCETQHNADAHIHAHTLTPMNARMHTVLL